MIKVDGSVATIRIKIKYFPSAIPSTINLNMVRPGVYISVYIKYKDSVRTSQKTLRLC